MSGHITIMGWALLPRLCSIFNLIIYNISIETAFVMTVITLRATRAKYSLYEILPVIVINNEVKQH